MATGQQLYDLLCQHLGQKYVLGAEVPKDVANYKGPWDCAEAISYGIFQLTGQLYGCENNHGNPHTADAYTGYWARDADKIGRIITINEAFKTAGALLLRKPTGKVGGHIVCSSGTGKTAEAHSTAKGFINSVVTGRRWDYGILPPMIVYNIPGAPTLEEIKLVNKKPDEIVYRWTNPLMVDKEKDGGPIWILQHQLKGKKYNCNPDGRFGEETFNAVYAFQKDTGLNADGEVGKDTKAALGITI